MVTAVANMFAEVRRIFSTHIPESIKSTGERMHYIAFASGVCAFVSDFLTRFKPNALLAVCATMALCTAVGLLIVYSGKVKISKLAAEAIVLAGLTAVLSLGVYIARVDFRLDPMDALQRSADDLKKSTDDNFRNTNAKIDKVMASLNPVQKSQIVQLNLTMNLPINALVILRSQVNQLMADLDPSKANAVFIQKANDLSLLQKQPVDFASADPRARGLAAEAEAALARADFDVASLKIKQAAEIERQSSIDLMNLARTRALDAARALQRSAQIAALALQYREAAEDLAKAAALVAPYDAHFAWQLTTEKADALYRQGDERGDDSATGEAVDTYSDALAMVSPMQDNADWVRSRDKLGVAVEKLGQHGGTVAARHQDAIATYRSALRGERHVAVPARENTGANPRASGTRNFGVTPRHRSSAAPAGTVAHTAEPSTPTAAQPEQQESGGFFSRVKSWVNRNAPEKTEQQSAPTEQSTSPGTARSQRGAASSRVLNTAPVTQRSVVIAKTPRSPPPSPKKK